MLTNTLVQCAKKRDLSKINHKRESSVDPNGALAGQAVIVQRKRISHNTRNKKSYIQVRSATFSGIVLPTAVFYLATTNHYERSCHGQRIQSVDNGGKIPLEVLVASRNEAKRNRGGALQTQNDNRP